MSDTPRTRFPVSALILTRDEEVNIERCLECLSFSDDIVVFDSHSTDRTVELAERHPGVRIVKRRFDNWSSHQNWAVENIEFRNPWVLYVDADERVPADLADEIMRRADPDSEMAAYRMRRKDMFMGRWIKRATLYPTWLVRMFRPERIRYERLVNPIAVVDGPIGDLRAHLIHFPFSKGVVQWFDRHNSYSTYEMHEQLKIMAGHRRPLSDILCKDPNLRRAALKDVFMRLPFRPHLKWFYHMVWRRAFLDGRPGWTYARLQFIYEYMITIKVREAIAESRGADDRPTLASPAPRSVESEPAVSSVARDPEAGSRREHEPAVGRGVEEPRVDSSAS